MTYTLVQVGNTWKVRAGSRDLKVGNGLTVVRYIKSLPGGSKFWMWDNSPVSVTKAILRVNFADGVMV